MRAVKGKDTAPEILVRKMIFSLGYRYRLHGEHLPGKPDIYFNQKKKAIFVHGCFWHGHKCKRGDRLPLTHRPYWLQKIQKNKLRDSRNLRLLHRQGWGTLVLWECQLRDLDKLEKRINYFLKKII
jgi:DNA mismatch endonuclease, patch repair protein